MRPQPVADSEPKAETAHPRVIQISSAPRARQRPADGQRPRPQPWTPREGFEIPSPPRPEPPPPPTAPELRLGDAHRVMLAAFFIVCAGMLIAMLAWRAWAPSDQVQRADAPVEPAAQEVGPGAGGPTVAPPPETRPAGTGSVTTEIRVLEPNYRVAPGDTLGSIARRHGTTIEALASINNLENRNSLSIGQRLIIP